MDGAGDLRRTAPVGGRTLLARRLERGGDKDGEEQAERLRRLWDLKPRNVEPVAGLARKGDDAWLLLRTYIGRPAAEVVKREELTTRHRVLLAADLLGGLAELHEAGIGTPSLGLESAIVDAEGHLLLVPCWPKYEAARAPEEEVRRAGDAVCEILGLGSGANGQPGAAEHDAPAVVAVARSVAAGKRRSAAEARDLLLTAAGVMTSRRLASESRLEIARVVRGAAGAPPPPKLKEKSPARTAPPVRTPAPTAASVLDRPRAGMPKWVLWGAALIVLLLLAIAFLPGLIGHARSALSGSSTGAVATPPPAKPSPTPLVIPQLPASAGDVKSVQITDAPCLPGQACPVRVEVQLQPQPGQKEVVWNFRIVDRCKNSMSETSGVDVTAGGGWSFVYGTSTVSLPSSGKVDLIAETTSPAAAASQPFTVGTGC